MRAGAAPGKYPVKISEAESSLEQPPHLSVSPFLFQKFQKLIYAETGIWLGSSKTALLCGRLFRRLRELEIGSLKDYYEIVSQTDQAEERARMIDAITTNETRFFREPRQFEFLTKSIFPRWQSTAQSEHRARRLRIWSAGCSSGEEPYTIAMLMRHHFAAESEWDIRIVASDISNRVLEKARRGIYPIGRLGELPPELLQEYMLRGSANHEGEMKVKVDIQKMIDFRRINLHDETSLPEAPFDAIFCRNVLIYFDSASKQKVVKNLLHNLVANGLLFVGHAENLANMTNELHSVESTIYVKTGARQQ